LDEFVMAGEIQETSTRAILKHIYDQNLIEKGEVIFLLDNEIQEYL
jgi:hypothetical protein